MPDYGLLNPTGTGKVFLNDGDDVFFTGGAKDTVLGGTGGDQIAGGSENDLQYGGSGDVALNCGSEDDRLEGGNGRDVLSGGDGADTLTGGRWDDRSAGGTGADILVFADLSGRDVITDYMQGVDHLQITASNEVAVLDLGVDCMLQIGLNKVLFLGVTAAQLADSDFL